MVGIPKDPDAETRQAIPDLISAVRPHTVTAYPARILIHPNESPRSSVVVR